MWPNIEFFLLQTKYKSFSLQPQKDMMFRSAAAANNLYSPAATSDSSGFSELHAYNNYSTFNPISRLDNQRCSSPQVPHTYHNPTLMASPYSTLPRRMAAHNSAGASIHSPGHGPAGGGGRNVLPIMASAVGRNSPLLELTGVNSTLRSSSLGRNMLLSNVEKDIKKSTNNTTTTTVRSPLLESGDDRESCV